MSPGLIRLLVDVEMSTVNIETKYNEVEQWLTENIGKKYRADNRGGRHPKWALGINHSFGLILVGLYREEDATAFRLRFKCT